MLVFLLRCSILPTVYIISLRWEMCSQISVLAALPATDTRVWKRDFGNRVNTQEFSPRDSGSSSYLTTRKTNCDSLHPSQHELFIITHPSQAWCSSQHWSGRKNFSLEWLKTCLSARESQTLPVAPAWALFQSISAIDDINKRIWNW